MKGSWVVWGLVAVAGYFILRSAGLLAFLGVRPVSTTSNPNGGSASGTVPQDAFAKLTGDISAILNNTLTPSAQIAPKTDGT